MKNALQSTTSSLPNRILRFLFQVICIGACLEGCHLVMGHARSTLFIYFGFWFSKTFKVFCYKRHAGAVCIIMLLEMGRGAEGA